METRCCRHLHFIAAIKCGTVTKVHNVSSCGKPALRLKSLKDIFESVDSRKISSDYTVEANKVLPLADRMLWKEDFGSSEFVRNDYDDDDSDMSDDSSLTLSQLKEISKGKKRKLSYCTHSNAKQVYDDFQFGDDEFDLKEPLSQWKQKLSKKKLKCKRKCSRKRAMKLELALVDTSEVRDGSEIFSYANRDLMPLVCVNTEDPKLETFEVPSLVDFIDGDELEYDSEIPYHFLEGHAYKNQELVLYGDSYQEYLADSPEDIEIDGCDSLQQVLYLEESRNCTLNEVCSDYLEPVLLLESVSIIDGTVETDQTRACSPTAASKDCWSSRNHCPHGWATTSEKQPPKTVSIGSECGSSSWNAPFLDDYALSGPVQNPGRFTQKIIPPTSQERLCMALNCEELHNDVDEFKCKEKLFLEEQNENTIARSDIEIARGTGNTVQPGEPKRRKPVISPNQILQKTKNENRGSPPKSYSRSLRSINTGCTSVTSCSKGAVAFSQRQMHGIDSLSGKLLNELKSMKDIIEQKLLFNPCRNLTLRNDADEVVEAIKAATRVEKNAKRMLSAMARDCNRYCKIMSLTQDGPSARENDIHREKRKIVFADEAGGMLHHIKFFENDSSSLPSLAPGPDNQNC